MLKAYTNQISCVVLVGIVGNSYVERAKLKHTLSERMNVDRDRKNNRKRAK